MSTVKRWSLPAMLTSPSLLKGRKNTYLLPGLRWEEGKDLTLLAPKSSNPIVIGNSSWVCFSVKAGEDTSRAQTHLPRTVCLTCLCLPPLKSVLKGGSEEHSDPL